VDVVVVCSFNLSVICFVVAVLELLLVLLMRVRYAIAHERHPKPQRPYDDLNNNNPLRQRSKQPNKPIELGISHPQGKGENKSTATLSSSSL